MLTLRLLPIEFGAMIRYLRQSCAGQQSVPLKRQSVQKLVMLQYLRTWTDQRLDSWNYRFANRAYIVNVPLAVAKAMYEELRQLKLSPEQQLFLNKLDWSIVNYRPPMNFQLPPI